MPCWPCAFHSTATKLRKVLNLAQIVQSHALSFFYLSAPDLLLGLDSDPAQRNILGSLGHTRRSPAMASVCASSASRSFEWLGGKRIHPGWVVPGRR